VNEKSGLPVVAISLLTETPGSAGLYGPLCGDKRMSYLDSLYSLLQRMQETI
jgi:hypothetical protein